MCRREDSQWTLLAACKASIHFAKVSQHLPLIIRQYHLVSGHSGVERVLNLIREKFGIVGPRTAVRGYLILALPAREEHVVEQKMADLPLYRITPDKPQSTYLGVD